MNPTHTGNLPVPDQLVSPNVLKHPTVSVVIIFLNAQKFLETAIESVLAQTFTDWELLLVDDGSSDASTDIAQSYVRRYADKVHYLEHPGHENRGMSASRNRGIGHATGEFIALLDADDIWLPEKLSRQVSIMEDHPEIGLLANPALYWYEDGVRKLQPMTIPTGVLQPGAWIPKILQNDNNAACPSSVLIRTRLIKSLSGFEESFRGPMMVFEDQVTWFKASLASHVYYDPDPLILYRIHSESCCMSTPSDQQLSARLVLYSRLTQLLQKQEKPCDKQKLILAMARTKECELFLRSDDEGLKRARGLRSASGSGKEYSVTGFFAALLLVGKVSTTTASTISTTIFQFCLTAYDQGVPRAIGGAPAFAFKGLRTWVPSSLKRFARRIIGWRHRAKARRQLASGIRPVSEVWATDRGVPIHRYYVDQFLEEFQSDVHGHCLEFQDNTYATRVGGSAVTKLDVLHIDSTNLRATIIADITKPNNIPSNHFDCIICTHVLHVIPDLNQAVSELYRILKPGGVLLVAVPQLSMCDPGWHELWRFTPEGLSVLLARAFGSKGISVRSYGNSLASAYEIRGIACHEVSPSVLDSHDQRFAIEVCARAVKQ